VEDAGSKSPTLANNRTIYTYYHAAGRGGIGRAQLHVLNIYQKIQNHTETEAHELVARFRADGGDDALLREHANDNARALRLAGYSAAGRTVKNSDGSIDSEIRIHTDDFVSSLQAFGDETQWPKEI
jgi:hypothetical protein